TWNFPHRCRNVTTSIERGATPSREIVPLVMPSERSSPFQCIVQHVYAFSSGVANELRAGWNHVSESEISGASINRAGFEQPSGDIGFMDKRCGLQRRRRMLVSQVMIGEPAKFGV